MCRVAPLAFGPVLLLVASAAPAPTDVRLAGGARVQAEVLRETEEAVYLDLGHDVLRVPREVITGMLTDEAPPPDQSQELEGHAGIDDFRQDLDLIRQAIVLVSTPSGFGTGFVIDPAGLIVTNYHVVRDEEFVRVTFYRPENETPLQIEDVEVLAFSRLHDIALLEIPEEAMPEERSVTLALMPNDTAEVGDPCFVIGNPGMGRSILAQTVSEGIISSLERNFNDLMYIQTTAAVNPGNSGGPLLSGGGRVIGLITYKAYFQENIAFALPVHEIRRFLAGRGAYLFSDMNPNAGHRYLDPSLETGD